MKTEPNDVAFSGNYGPGLTKREYFAAMAMQGMLAGDFIYTPEDAVRHAEALIEALNK